ncbi:GNAT family N-acetyltransferase [Lysobacter humi (ex Lee et al. 2017)]
MRARGLTAADLDWLRALYASTREDELAGLPWPHAMREAFLAQQFAFQHIDYVGRHPQALFLALHAAGGAPVGRLYLAREAPMHRLIDVALFPAHRGRGVGRALLGGVQADAQAAGRGVTLHVAHDNPRARQLYERLGFAAVEDGATHRRMAWSPRKGLS